MSLAPVWRNRLSAFAAAIVAIGIGYEVAQGNFFWPVVFAGLVSAVVFLRLQTQPLATLLLGLAMIGYIVGNRGFAQLSLSATLPLLPAEFVLMVVSALLLVRCAQSRELPFRRDPLNVAIVLWIVISSVRLAADVRAYGFMAVRDYAMVYYALFFFLGQDAGRSARSRRFLWGCLAFSSATLLVIYPVFLSFPDVFLGTLTVRGSPIIYFKGDLAGTFMAMGAVLLFMYYEQRRRLWALVLSLALVGATIASNNRASMLGLAIATVVLLLGRRWRFAAAQAIGGAIAAVVLLVFAYVQNESWEQTPVHGVYERVVSLADPMGKRTYSDTQSFNKGDNNLFRAVWWQAVFDETVTISPWLGLGYGYDLAERFIREYYPESGEDFSTRSPHNILLTTFARTGLVGLVPYLVISALIMVRALRAARRDLETGAWWAAACVILVSACFGVVLEGPMGALVYWTVLGVANAAYHVPVAGVAFEGEATISDPHLRTVPAGDELASAP